MKKAKLKKSLEKEIDHLRGILDERDRAIYDLQKEVSIEEDKYTNSIEVFSDILRDLSDDSL